MGKIVDPSGYALSDTSVLSNSSMNSAAGTVEMGSDSNIHEEGWSSRQAVAEATLRGTYDLHSLRGTMEMKGSMEGLSIWDSDEGIAGVGIFLKQEPTLNGGCVYVEHIVEKCSADRSGRIRVYDLIVGVDGDVVEGEPLSTLRNIITGQQGTYVVLAFRRVVDMQKPFDFRVKLMRGTAEYCESNAIEMENMPLAGGFQKGDRVRSLIDHASLYLVKGDMGTIVGPYSHKLLARQIRGTADDTTERVCVDFGVGKGTKGKGEINVLANSHIKLVESLLRNGERSLLRASSEMESEFELALRARARDACSLDHTIEREREQERARAGRQESEKARKCERERECDLLDLALAVSEAEAAEIKKRSKDDSKEQEEEWLRVKESQQKVAEVPTLLPTLLISEATTTTNADMPDTTKDEVQMCVFV